MRSPTALVWDDRLPEADKAVVAKLNASLERLDGARAVEIVVAEKFARSKIAWKLATYQHALLHRIVALMDGTALGWNNRNTLAAMLSARALMETVAQFAELERQITQFLAAEDLGGLDALAQSGIFASRDPEWLAASPDTKATNVLTYVDKFDKRAEGFRGHYDRLSERCHPNMAGHSQMFSKLDRTNGRVGYLDDAHTERNGHMILAAVMVLLLVEKMSALIDASIEKVAELQHRLHPVPPRES